MSVQLEQRFDNGIALGRCYLATIIREWMIVLPFCHVQTKKGCGRFLHKNENYFCLVIKSLTQGQEQVLEHVSVVFPIIHLLLFFTELCKSLFRCSHLPQHFVGNLGDKLNTESQVPEVNFCNS